jgi:uncharacterized protein (TIGR03382 family)
MGARLVAAVVVVVCAATTAFAQRGVPQGGFPTWQERLLLVYVNRGRADPVADLAGCTVCAEKACYAAALTPVAYSYGLNRAARFHGAHLEFSNRFQHDSPCSLVTDLSNQYVPVGTCLGETSCACVGGTLTGTTTAVTRTNRFITVSAWGENIAYGYSTPRQTFYQWLWEPESSATCGFRSTNGHRYNILEPSRRLLGNGYYRISRHMWVQDFNGGSNPTGTLIAGGHEPQFSGGTVEFRVNYFDTGAPMAATVNVDGACSPMTRERGQATNATYLASQSLGGTTCRRYRFEFKNPAGTTVYLPEMGSYGVGGSGTICDDWNMATPAACGAPPNQAPMVAAAAAASPAPVTATTTALTALGSDDGGEGALTYTWSATGPAAVTFSANGTNAAKSSTATFARAGAYTFTVTMRDAANLTSTSTVNVTVNQTMTTLAVSPPTASVPAGMTQQFAGTGYDQFAMSLATQPATTWVVAGGGTIDATGRFTADTTVGGPYTVTAMAGGKSGTAQVSVTGPNAPTVAQAASATPSPVTGTTTTATVTGASGAGEPALTYTWTSSGPAPVMVAPNGTNAAKTATITFAAAGNYTLTAQIKDAQNQTATSSVALIVAATPTTVDIQPRTAVVVVNTAKDFAASVADQFGKPAATATPAWTTTGGGTIDANGRFTAGAMTGGPFTLTATAEGASGTAQIVVAEMEDTTPPAIAITSPANGAELSGNAMIETQPTDDLHIGRVVITVAGEDHELTASPWQHLWDTTALADGEYTIEARAYDLADNPSAPVSITVFVHPGGAKDGGGCGCASSSPANSAWLLLVLLALRRRRRAT